MAESNNGIVKVHNGTLEYLVGPDVREVFIRHKERYSIETQEATWKSCQWPNLEQLAQKKNNIVLDHNPK